VVDIIFTIVVAIALWWSGYTLQVSGLNVVFTSILGSGIILVFIGILGFISSGGLEEDGTWTMMMSPFAGNN